MSDEARYYVKRYSPFTNGTFWVHYALADIANAQHDYELWVTPSRLMDEWPFSERTIQRAYTVLEEDGFLERLTDPAPGRPVRYRLLMPEIQTNGRSCGLTHVRQNDANARQNVGDARQDGDRSPITRTEKNTGSKNRARDQLFDALVEVCQIDPKALTSSARGAANRAIKELREVGAEPEQIVQAARAYRTRYPGAVVTPSALAKHWPSLLEGSPAPAQTAAPQCSECRGTGYVTEDNDARIVSPCWSCS